MKRAGVWMMAVLAWPVAAVWGAEAVVVDAAGGGLVPGQAVDGAKPLVLAVGQKVTLVTADGRTVRLAGPFNGPPVPGPEPAEGSVSGSLTHMFAARSTDNSSLGVVRGAADQPPVPEPWLVDVRHGGSRCLREGEVTLFWLEKPLDHPGELVVAPADRSWSARAVWPAGAPRLAIPATLPLRDRHTYTVSLDGAEAPTTVHVLPRSVRTDAARAAWMAEMGCEAQATALAAQLGAGGR